MLQVSEIDVSYGHFQVLSGVSLQVSDKELVTVIGSNGAGKTTLLNTIAGLLPPKRGEIRFMGKRIDGLPPHKVVEEGLVLVPEGRGNFSRLTVLENLELSAYTGRAKERKDETLEEVFNIFPILRERRHQKAGTLSGGEQQMLAIGRGLMARPKLLMLDEPSLGLAPKIVLQIFSILRQLKEEGITILLIEQNAHRALELADRAYLLETGRIAMQGRGEELLQDPHLRKLYLGI
ncbi:MAG: ABC transporter ATP-binding protein [Candidatus Bathyarchaeia archaeon]